MSHGEYSTDDLAYPTEPCYQDRVSRLLDLVERLICSVAGEQPFDGARVERCQHHGRGDDQHRDVCGPGFDHRCEHGGRQQHESEFTALGHCSRNAKAFIVIDADQSGERVEEHRLQRHE